MRSRLTASFDKATLSRKIECVGAEGELTAPEGEVAWGVAEVVGATITQQVVEAEIVGEVGLMVVLATVLSC